MKKLFLGWLLLLSSVCFAGNVTLVDLPAAVSGKKVQVSARAVGGLGENNLRCLLENTTPASLKIRIPAGVYFQSGEEGAQNLLLLQEYLIVLAPRSKNEIVLTGYCMQSKNFAPGSDKIYVYQGLAPAPLKTLGDSLNHYPDLRLQYGQMFVWAITDKKQLYDIWVADKLMAPAYNIMQFVAKAAGLAAGRVRPVSAATAMTARPPLAVFSKRSILLFHNPVNQRLSFKIYNDRGQVYHTHYENQLIPHGMKEYTFGINELVEPNESPVFYAKITDASGKVLAQQKVDKNTKAVKRKPEARDFTFSFALAKGVKKARLNVYLEDGTLVEEFKRYEYLPVGNYNIQVTLLHLRDPNTRFVAKLLDENNATVAQQTVAKP
ncbi:hypothetical protein I5M27_10705 [Adhaeribacter sp. BT258]|uniref:Uncharacterized protein n=1 Tax=Adhaeribacter terrigena TaxID=2793070 RepID=A0ABS1C234_9BACT|nr:hypothetical protein [Adhaeribacter terrigena]MBK0403456.1 hypothetical protein [Adhaeribacter terrigena]